MRTGSVRFAYRRIGSGPNAIVPLHGWPRASWAWRGVMPLLGNGLDVIAPDLAQ